MRPRILCSRLRPAERRIYRAVLGYFLVVLLAMVWPLVTLFSHARPLVLGLPFFLFYLAVWLVLSFLVLLALFLWEGRSGASPDPPEERS